MIINGIPFRLTNRGRQSYIESVSFTDKIDNDTIIKACLRNPFAWWTRASKSNLHLLVYFRYGKQKKVPDYTTGWPEETAEDLLNSGVINETRYKIFHSKMHKFLKTNGHLPDGETVKGFLANVKN